MVADYNKMISENDRRKELLNSPYDPNTGFGSPIDRVKISYMAQEQDFTYYIPRTMYNDFQGMFDRLVGYGSVEEMLESAGQPVLVDDFIKSIAENRFQYDFEYWAIASVKIQDKETKAMIPFKLNQAQRKLLAKFEEMRLSGAPIRIILLKARQWGGSTLTQVYMAWMQVILKTNWHSAIIADQDDQARNIRAMYTKLAKNYPAVIGAITFGPYEGSTKNRLIAQRDCIVGVSSAQTPDSLRSYDFSMLHLSEVGLFKTTQGKSPEDLVQSVRATVPDVPDSMIVLESTAKGVGNFFHREWLAAKEGQTYYKPVFVAWFEIERYQKPIKDYGKFIRFVQKDEYALFLWDIGATLEGIKWYFDTKRGDNYDDWRMKSEYPSNDVEAFQSTGRRVFAQDYVIRARQNCTPPEFIGDIEPRGIKGKAAFDKIAFHPEDRGLLQVWMMPDKSLDISNRYEVSVDIGGRTEKADYSVIKVIDRYWMIEGGGPEVVAVWAGHLDQDLVAWKAAQIARWYNNALLVVEYNSLDTDESEGEHHLTVLDEIVEYYTNIYARTDPERVRQNLPLKYGFHTNRSTKPMVIDEMNGALREGAYVERDVRACDEMDTYEIKSDGKYGAVEGCYDDHVMTTAIGLWVCFKFMSLPKVVIQGKSIKGSRIRSEASF